MLGLGTQQVVAMGGKQNLRLPSVSVVNVQIWLWRSSLDAVRVIQRLERTA